MIFVIRRNMMMLFLVSSWKDVRESDVRVVESSDAVSDVIASLKCHRIKILKFSIWQSIPIQTEIMHTYWKSSYLVLLLNMIITQIVQCKKSHIYIDQRKMANKRVLQVDQIDKMAIFLYDEENVEKKNGIML